MVRYKATIAYDGTAFSGFQKQPGQRTVEEELTKTLVKISSGSARKLYAAGRTDAGVHAYGQVVHFDLPQPRDLEKLRFALDTQSAADIACVDVELVSDDFHARYDKHEKTYEFLVDTGRPKNPMLRHYATAYPYALNLQDMQEAIQAVIGTHDFTGFTATGTAVQDKVRTITQASVSYQADKHLYIFRFTGNGFLYKQVRNMVGTLLKIGNGRMPIEQMARVIREKDRHLAGPTAGPQGLYLKEIRYDQ